MQRENRHKRGFEEFSSVTTREGNNSDKTVIKQRENKEKTKEFPVVNSERTPRANRG